MFQLHRLPVEKVADTLWSDKEDECPGTLYIVHVHVHVQTSTLLVHHMYTHRSITNNN